MPVDETGPLAQPIAGFDPTPVIAAAEQGLIDFLNTPTKQVLSQLPLQRSPEEPPAGAADPKPVDPTQVISPVLDAVGAVLPGLSSLDPTGLISPVVNALGTLGTGQFSGLDPMQILGGVSNAFDRTASSLGQALGVVANDWQGGSGSAAGAKTRAAVANGAEVATQADGLRDNLSTAAANVAQARSRMIDIIDDFHAKVAAANLSTPAGRAAAVAAANQAVKDSTAVMTELQGTLGAQAEKVSAIGRPTPVTAKPEPTPPAHAEPPGPPPPDPALTVRLPDGKTVQAPNPVAASAVRNALTQLGVPYKWGGQKPGVAFDCSGLTQWAYGEAGVHIPDVSRDQDVGARISRADVQPGDLVVWDGHVAMVVGDGKMIEAGDPVQLSPIRTNNLKMPFEGFYRPTA